MCFVKTGILPLVMFSLLSGCGGMNDDLLPSGTDRRPPVESGTAGAVVGQNAPDFTLSDTLGNSITLSSTVSAAQAVVLYFTMWCPICDAHMSHMRETAIPQFPNVRFLAVDYVSGSVAGALNAQIENGYGGPGFTVLADTDQTVLDLYQATMGTTVVVDPSGVIHMNEDYKDGVRLQAVLAGLP